MLRVHSIQRFCLHDGPGIRTTVFLQGCPLHCWWCHNPTAIPLRSPAAKPWPIDELVEHLLRDQRYWRPSGGGVTLSGGEPLLQAEPAARLLERVGERGVHRCIETAGHVPLTSVQRIAPHVDLWLWDVKSADAQRFREGTGGRAELPLENLAWLLAETPAAVRVRTPVIASFNDDEPSARGLARALAALPRHVEVELLPGHDLQRDAAAARRRSAKVTPQRLSEVADILRADGCTLVGPP